MKRVGLASSGPKHNGDLLATNERAKVAPAGSQNNTDVPDCPEVGGDLASEVERGMEVLESWGTADDAAVLVLDE